MRRLVVHCCLAVAFVALAAPFGPAWAQFETGRISGTVADPQGGVVPGVTVTAKSPNTGATRETVTDTEGRFVIPNLSPDAYDVTYSLTGFKTVQRKVTVTVGADIAADAKLEVGGVTETVSVTAEPELIDTRTGEFRTTVTSRQISELPTLTRDPYDLVALSGNVREVSPDELTLVGGGGRGTGFSINGQRTASTNIMLDGGDNNYLYTAGVGQEIPLDAVQEFSVISNNFSAQYGRASGGIVNLITKSGTNRFSGTASEFFRSEKLSNNSPDNEAREVEKGTFRRNQLGYTLGGPILKDKVHFFSALEYIGIRSQDTLFSWVVTPEFLAAVSPNTRNYFNAFGGSLAGTFSETLTRAQVEEELELGAAGPFNSLPANLPVFRLVGTNINTDAGGGFPGDTYQTINKIDINFNNSTRATIGYAYLKQDNDKGTQSFSAYDRYNTGTLERKHNLNGSVTRVWANNFTSQSKLVWNKLSEDQPANGPAEPRLQMNTQGSVSIQGNDITFPGYYPTIPQADLPAGGPQKLTQFHQDQTWLKGAHDIRFGGTYVHIADDHFFASYASAVEGLAIVPDNQLSLDNLVLGQLARFQLAINPNGYPLTDSFVTPAVQPDFLSKNRYNEFALYANDNWSIGNRLVLNLGLRYEYYGPQRKTEPKYDSNFYYGSGFDDLDISSASPTEIVAAYRTGQVFPSNESPLGSLWRADKNNWAPRLGFAWDVNGDGRTAVRGGYGIAYERNFGNITFNVIQNVPEFVNATIDSPTNVPTQPIYTDNLGPFAEPGVTKVIPVGSLRHVDQNIETAYAHLYGLSLTKELAGGVTGSIEYNGSTGRKLYDLADLNKAGAPLVYEGVGSPVGRPNTQYSVFNTRGNRGKSQYHGLVFGADTRQLGSSGLALTGRYAWSHAKDNVSETFGLADNNGFFNVGYLDAFNADVDYGNAGFDVRHRISASAVWSLPFGGDSLWAGGWQVNALFNARSGYPFSVFDCANAFAFCMRALDPVGIDRVANGDEPTGSPNEYTLLDLSPLQATYGSYVHPVQGTNDFGPYPDTMTKRNDFYGPGAWNLDVVLGKRFRFGNKAAVFRLEMYNIFNHHNMYVQSDAAEVSVGEITGYRDDFRRMQLGFKFEF